ncbi:putative outer membrane lipoprotein [Candidatus Protochlamydia naegleriophila]|uniref:Putative outer membrane lipoprotein n=1 Tax=Candidatus Protochlamydia naegleriophila TaxID=389348 RepID=A0A0U5JGE0_9BACT|nr:glycine zipper 2TM domain-containing protein [Candidatus Protochlamydia naegleriophila]CUI16981.1 putative outer membrane lipoprotein [Candidatus Protochlamydia naegleriophila]
MKIASKIILAVSALTLMNTGSLSAHSYGHTSRYVGEASMTYTGVIRSIREIIVEKHSSHLGTVGGGVAGGVIGSAIGRGRFLPTALGAVTGAVTGSLIEKRSNQRVALEYIIELSNGGLMTIVQSPGPYNVGQPVYVIVSPSGHSRLAPM